MGKKRDPYGVTPAYLAWKRKGSPGVFDLENNRQVPVEEIHDDPVVSLMKELGTPMTRENYLELAYLKKDPVLSAEEEAELPEQFKLRDPEDVLDLLIELGDNEVDVIITCEEDARCQHEVYWPGCAACEFSGPKGVQ
jgi:hypothetical protein